MFGMFDFGDDGKEYCGGGKGNGENGERENCGFECDCGDNPEGETGKWMRLRDAALAFRERRFERGVGGLGRRVFVGRRQRLRHRLLLRLPMCLGGVGGEWEVRRGRRGLLPQGVGVCCHDLWR